MATSRATSRELDVLQQPVDDAVDAPSVGRVGEPVDDVAEEVHRVALPRPRGEQPLGDARSAVGHHGQGDDSTVPTTSGVLKSRLSPSRMNWPSPPSPMSEVMVTSPMVVTDVMRMPAMIAGSGQRQLDPEEHARRRSTPCPRPTRRIVGRHALEAGDDVADQDQQRVADERDDRRSSVDRPGVGDEEGEQGQRRDACR